MDKTINIELSTTSIAAAISQLKAYRQEIDAKTERLRRIVAEEMALLAQAGFDASYVDYLVDGQTTPATVAVNVEHGVGETVVAALGEDAVWVEFGAGVYYNGSAGSSPNPLGENLGFTIGSYGKGMGKRNVWGYTDGDKVVLTHGTPATMPMYNALRKTCSNILFRAKEVFE